MVLAVKGSNPFNHLMQILYISSKNVIQSKLSYSLKLTRAPLNTVQTLGFKKHYALLSSKFNTTYFFTKKLLKLSVWNDKLWTSGIVSKILFTVDSLESRLYLNALNARKEWGLWLYTFKILNTPSSLNLGIFIYNPWSVRMRRLFKVQALSSNSPSFTTIRLNNNYFYSPKRRIKRWLKKKYTTQSWR